MGGNTMRRFITPTVLTFTFLLLFVCPKLAIGILYDFEDAAQLNDWEIVADEWTIEGGALVGTTPAGQYFGIYTGDSSWSDYFMEFTATKLEGSYVYINFRVQDNMDRYDYEASYGTNTTTIFRWDADAATEIIPGGKAGSAPLPAGDTHTYRVEVAGANIKAYLDGELLYDFEDDTFETGGIGMAGTSSKASFDNIEIEGTGVPKTAVEPAFKLTSSWGRIKQGF